jgi:UDP-N-acetyl-D-glucosamine dehydrogenase
VTRPTAACTTYVLCVPTPLREGMPDLRAVESAARAVASVLSAGDLVVLDSTTYPGTTEEVVRPLLDVGSGLLAGLDYLLAYSPERIDPGNPTYGIRNTPKVVGGLDEGSTKAAVRFYEQVCDTVVQVDGTREAEMAKLLENTFRHVNIALVNEMAVFCRELGIDLWQVIEAARTKPFGFMPFYPGPGVGGHCIPVDPSYLSWRVRKLGFTFRFVELAQEINAQMPSYVVTRLGDLLNDAGLALSRSRVLCLGAAYKPGVADVRESPAVEVMRQLRRKGATVCYADPHVPWLVLDAERLTAVDLATALADVDRWWCSRRTLPSTSTSTSSWCGARRRWCWTRGRRSSRGRTSSGSSQPSGAATAPAPSRAAPRCAGRTPGRAAATAARRWRAGTSPPQTGGA